MAPDSKHSIPIQPFVISPCIYKMVLAAAHCYQKENSELGSYKFRIVSGSWKNQYKQSTPQQEYMSWFTNTQYILL